jgi:hypothetical protein
VGIAHFRYEKKIGARIFCTFKKQELFKTVHTNGFTVEWDQEIDLCPDELYYDSVLINSNKNIYNIP